MGEVQCGPRPATTCLREAGWLSGVVAMGGRLSRLEFSRSSRGKATRARRRGVATVVVALLLLLLVGAPARPALAGPSSEYCHSRVPSSAADYQAAFDGMRAANTGGWIANDGGLPVPLADGRLIWLFGDTLIGSAPNLQD